MPTVPLTTRSVTQRPTANARISVPTTADDFGGINARTEHQKGRDIASLGASLALTGEIFQAEHKEMRTEVDRATVNLTDNKVAENIRALLHNPESGYLSKRGSVAFESLDELKEQIKAIGSSASEGLKNPRQQKLYKSVLDKRLGIALVSAVKHAQRETLNYSTEAHKARIDTQAIEAVQSWRDPATVIRSTNTALEDIQQFGERFGLPEEEVQRQQSIFQNTVNQALVSQMVDEGELVSASNYFDGVRDKLEPSDEVRLSRLITSAGDELERKQKQAIAEQNKAYKQQVEAATSDLEIGVSRGESGYLEIEKAFANGEGWLPAAKRTQLIKMADKTTQRFIDDQNRVARVATAFESGTRLDPQSPKDNKAVDAWFNTVSPIFNELPTNERLSRITSFVSVTGVVPSQIKNFIRVNSRSGEAENAVLAANMLDRLRDSNPQILDSFSQNEHSFAALVADTIDAGTEPKQAVELARKRIYDTTPAEREVIGDRLALGSTDFKKNNIEVLNGLIDEHFDPVFRTQPNIPVPLQAEYNGLVELYAYETQDLSVARKLAGTDIRRVWGVTGLNGDLEMMKYAPETLFGNGLDSTDWIKQQMVDDLTIFGLQNTDRVKLIADSHTARSPKSGYIMMRQQDDGLLRPILGEGNQPLRWAPEFKSSAAGKEHAAEIEKSIKESREKHNALLERKANASTPKRFTSTLDAL
jgi:hypothetical protein